MSRKAACLIAVGIVFSVASAQTDPYGFIQDWLILGPYGQGGGAAPGEDLVSADYLTDGDTIEEVIVPADMCIGCGVCAACCPVGALEMRLDKYGEYTPIRTDIRCISCQTCLTVCPFWGQDDDEDSLAGAAYSHISGIQHRPETGYHWGAYVGHVSDTASRLDPTDRRPRQHGERG